MKRIDAATLLDQAQAAVRARDDVALVQALSVLAVVHRPAMTDLWCARWVAALRRLKLLDAAETVLAQCHTICGTTRRLYIEAAELATAQKNTQRAADGWLAALAESDAGALTPVQYRRAMQSLLSDWRVEAAAQCLARARAETPNDPEWARWDRTVQTYSQLTPQLLADWPGCARITAYWQRQPAQTLLVTFATLYSDIDTPAFGFPFISQQGWDHIHVAQAAKTQYQGLTAEQLAQTLAPWLHGRDVWTYGSSLGGYAAIYYATALGARAIASSPSLPAHVQSIRFPRDKVPIAHTPLERFTTAQTCYIFYDPEDAPDRLFVRELVLPACTDAVVVELPYAGHQALRQLASAGLLKDTLIHIITHAPREVPLDLHALAQTPVYWAQRARDHFKQKQWDLGIEAGQRSLAAQSSLTLTQQVLQALVKTQRLDEAQALYTAAAAHFGAAKLAPWQPPTLSSTRAQPTR